MASIFASRKYKALAEFEVKEIGLDDVTLLQAGMTLLQSAARRGDNVGLDEFPTVEYFQERLKTYCARLFFLSRGPILDALVVVRESHFSRGHAHIADIWVILSGELTEERLIFLNLLDFGEAVAADNVEMFTCTYSAAVTNVGLIKELLSQGYYMSLILPMGIKVAKSGHVDYAVLAKDIRALPQSMSKSDRACSFNRHILEDTTHDPDYIRGELPKFDTLKKPFVVTLSCGMEVVLRHMRSKEEIIPVFRMFMQAAQAGKGYAADEYNDLAHFEREFCLTYVTVIVEERKTGRIVGALMVGRSSFCRSVTSLVADGHLGVDPEYEGMKLGKDLSNLLVAMAKGLDYKYFFNDTPINNSKVIYFDKGIGFVSCGSLPASVCFTEVDGWLPTVGLCLDMKNVHPFPHFAENLPYQKKPFLKAYPGRFLVD